MPENKNQHYVPRALLKPFTMDGEDKAINVFNMARERVIQGAPVKSQCSRDYFYGDDLLVERGLQPIEGAYRRIIDGLLADPTRVNDGEKSFLKQFWLLQHQRTEAASKRVQDMTLGVGAIVEPAVLPVYSDKKSVATAIESLPRLLPTLTDMKVCLIRNRTLTPFITSDDPAILANRWHDVQGIRVYGLASAGALFILPISPELLCMCYDGGVYRVPHESGCVMTSNAQDVHAINQLQLLNSRKNVYFRDLDTWPDILSVYESIRHRRAEIGIKLQYAVSEERTSNGERFARVDRKVAPGDRGLISFWYQNPRPTAWPSFLQWRPDGAAFHNGSAAGFLRRAHAHGGLTPFRKYHTRP